MCFIATRPHSLGVASLRFSLRTLFAAVTLFALAGGWLLNTYRLVNDRREFLPELDSGGAVFAAQLRPADEARDVSWIRKLMGDRACGTIIYAPQRDPDGSELRKVRALFPEAHIWGWPDQQNLPQGIEPLPASTAIGDWEGWNN
jgi:hypothetical protein